MFSMMGSTSSALVLSFLSSIAYCDVPNEHSPLLFVELSPLPIKPFALPSLHLPVFFCFSSDGKKHFVVNTGSLTVYK